MFRVTFATSCYEKDWKEILLEPDYLAKKQIAYHCYPFVEKLLVINNVENLEVVKQASENHVKQGTLTNVVIAQEEILSFFQLQRSDFVNDWVYYNALAPLTAIHACTSDFLLYMTGDSFLPKPVSWIHKALKKMSQYPQYKVANLTWNDNYKEVKKESYKRDGNFFIAKRGFSDQMFLVAKQDFRQPIYGCIHPESHHFPRGDVFEKRAFSAMIERNWERLTYAKGSYQHQNF